MYDYEYKRVCAWDKLAEWSRNSYHTTEKGGWWSNMITSIHNFMRGNHEKG